MANNKSLFVHISRSTTPRTDPLLSGRNVEQSESRRELCLPLHAECVHKIFHYYQSAQGAVQKRHCVGTAPPKKSREARPIAAAYIDNWPQTVYQSTGNQLPLLDRTMRRRFEGLGTTTISMAEPNILPVLSETKLDPRLHAGLITHNPSIELFAEAAGPETLEVRRANGQSVVKSSQKGERKSVQALRWRPDGMQPAHCVNQLTNLE